MKRATQITVVALLILAPSASAFDHPTTFRRHFTVAPNHSALIRSQPLHGVSAWRRMGVWVDGKAAPVVDYRRCSADLLARHVLVTIDSCGKGVVIRAATAGTVMRHVRVMLSEAAR